ncbi:MAG: hypothetical protein V3W05_06290 [candidate division NC10 bacterium]
MEQIVSIIGMISGLIAIYSFVTGVTALPQLGKLPAQPMGEVAVATEPSRKRLLFLVPLFLVSLGITLVSGLRGSDTGGIMFILLLLTGVSLLLYFFWLHRTISQMTFSFASVVALGSLGLLFGSISRGEEGAGLIMGILAGIGTAVITRMSGESVLSVLPRIPTPGQPLGGIFQQRDPAGSAEVIDAEKEILRVAAQLKGEVRITDIAMETALSLDKAREALDSLSQRGHCTKVTLDSGATVFRFPDLLPEGD